MSDEIVVYNLEDDGTPTESVASQPPVTTGVAGASTATQSVPSGSPASPITEGDVRSILHQELSHYSGDFRIGALLSGQVFILDGSGMRLGGTDFDTAPFSVDYDGNFTATNGYILGSMRVGNGATYIIIDGANSLIKSSNYVAETAGWQIDKNGDADFNNARIRGRISTSVFVKDEVSAVGGQLIVANADVLASDMTAADASTLTIKGDTTLALNSMLHLKDGTDEEYMRVTAIGSAPTYTVTRDLAGAYSANANPAWKEGTAVVVEGLSDGVSTYSGGFLKLLGAGTNSPKYSVYKRTGVAYNAITEYCTLGNLKDLVDYSSDEFGIAIGTSTAYITYDPTNGLRIKGAASVNGSQLGFQNVFGDGSDGSATISGDTSLSRDMFYTDLTIDSGVTLDTAGFRLHCTGTLTVNGTLGRPGNAGGAGGDTTDENAGAAGTAGAALASGSVNGTVAGVAGAAGGAGTLRTTNGLTSVDNGTNGTVGNNVVKSLTDQDGVAAGNSTASVSMSTSAGTITAGAAKTGGAAGTKSGTVFNKPRTAFAAWLLQDFFPTADSLRSSAGSGSGAGGTGGGAERSGTGTCTVKGTGGGGGGGSGSPGGIVGIYAKTIVVSATGTITAKGGDGGRGGNSGDGVITGTTTGDYNAQAGGPGGGGGGGSGGVLILTYSSLTNSGSITSAGGTGGAGGTHGRNNASGVYTDPTGSSGTSGSNGNAGITVQLTV